MTVRSEAVIESALTSGMKYSVSEARKLLYFMIDPYDIKRSSELHKHLFFEMYPLLYVAEALHDVKWIRFSGMEQKYDGEIKFMDSDRKQKIEFVRAVSSEEEAVKSQIEKLKKTLPDLNISEDDDIVIHDEKKLFKEMKKLRWLWRKAFNKKFHKNKKTKQYEGVWLGIVFNDTHIPPSAYPKMRKRARRMLKKRASYVLKPFRRVFIIGLSGNFIFDSREIKDGYFRTEQLKSI